MALGDPPPLLMMSFMNNTLNVCMKQCTLLRKYNNMKTRRLTLRHAKDIEYALYYISSLDGTPNLLRTMER